MKRKRKKVSLTAGKRLRRFEEFVTATVKPTIATRKSELRGNEFYPKIDALVLHLESLIEWRKAFAPMVKFTHGSDKKKLPLLIQFILRNEPPSRTSYDFLSVLDDLLDIDTLLLEISEILKVPGISTPPRQLHAALKTSISEHFPKYKLNAHQLPDAETVLWAMGKLILESDLNETASPTVADVETLLRKNKFLATRNYILQVRRKQGLNALIPDSKVGRPKSVRKSETRKPRTELSP